MGAHETTRTDDRRRRILDEACAVFFDKGYERACIDDLIARVGGSKRTIYAAFGNKEGLFAAMIADLVEENSRQIIEGLDCGEQSGADLRQTVMDHGLHLLRVLTSPKVLAFYRIILAEGQRFPALAQAFFDKGPARSTRRFAEVLERFRARGEIDVADCEVAADQFCGLIRDGRYLSVLLGLAPPESEEDMHARVARATDTFLKGIAPRT